MNTQPKQQAHKHNGQGAQQLQLVSFTVGDELFAVDILRVQEINLRGRIIPVLDLRVQFGFPRAEKSEHTRIIVIEIKGNTIGFVVDSVREVMRITSNIVEPSPRMGSPIDASYVSGVAKLDDQLLILLELENLLSAESLHNITTMKAAA